MSRRLESKNKQNSFVTKERMKKKSAKLATDINSFIDLSLKRYDVSCLIDYDRLHEVIKELKFITTIE